MIILVKEYKKAYATKKFVLISFVVMFNFQKPPHLHYFLSSSLNLRLPFFLEICRFFLTKKETNENTRKIVNKLKRLNRTRNQ